MECELNGLLKRQGKVNSKNREIRKLKKKLMDEIVLLANEMEEYSGSTHLSHPALLYSPAVSYSRFPS